MLKKINPQLATKWMIFVAIILLYFGRGFNDFRGECYIEGDGFEYVIMTEAIYNHGTPDIQKQDIESFYKEAEKKYPPSTFYPKSYLESLLSTYERPSRPFMECYNGLYNTHDNKIYSYHYFTYSAFCTLAKAFCANFGYEPLKTFHITNALCVIAVCFLLLFFFSNSFIVSIFSSLCFCFGVNYWYLGWEHTEIFTTCFVAAGLIFFFKEKKLTGLLLIAIAASQNQPLLMLFMLLALVIAIPLLINKQLKLKVLIVLFLTSGVAISPMLFYYYHFDTPNLIKDLGFLDNHYMTFNRILGFYFDLNQGMILCLPIILPAYIVLLIICLFNKNLSITDKLQIIAIPLAIIGISVGISSMKGWNAGQAIVNRYVTWTSAIVFIHALFLIEHYNKLTKLFLLNNFLASQLIVCFYFEGRNVYDWEGFQHNHISDWFFENYPDLYNPDPAIFSLRTSGELNVKDKTEPVIYFDEHSHLRKVMFNHTNIKALEKWCKNPSDLERFKSYPSNYNWSYFKEADLKILKPDNEIFMAIRAMRINFHKESLRSNTGFMLQLPQRMKDLNKTKEEVLEFDAYYYATEEERKRNL